MLPLGYKVVSSLTEAESGTCGIHVDRLDVGVVLGAEWSHSLNMLDIDLTAIYEEVCELMARGDIDVIVSCCETTFSIGFIISMRDNTGYMRVDNKSMFTEITDSMQRSMVIKSCVWQQLITRGHCVTVRTAKDSNSCCLQLHKCERGLQTILKFALLVAALAVLLGCGFVYCMQQRSSICHYVVNAAYPAGSPYCNTLG